MADAATGKVYEFYKGGLYKITDIASDTVIYEDVKTKEQYRLKKDFWESIALNDKGQYVERFKLRL